MWAGSAMCPVVSPKRFGRWATTSSCGTPNAAARMAAGPSGSVQRSMLIGPGETVRARTPCGPNSSFSALASAFSAALAAP